MDRSGFELGDAGAEAALVRAWCARASGALAGLQGHLSGAGKEGEQRRQLLTPAQIVLLVHRLAPFASYAPWTQPALGSLATATLATLHPPPPCSSSSSEEERIGLLVNAHAHGLLEWARGATAGGAWKSPSAASVRYAVPWLLCRLRGGTLGEQGTLGLALPLALRLCDDWEATNVWCGLSSLAALLTAATPTAMAPWGPLVAEALARAGACGAAKQHATLALTLAHTRALALAVFHGICPPPTVRVLARALARRGEAGGAAGVGGGGAGAV